MALMQITFSGKIDEFEYDVDSETNTIMFHDKKTSTIFLGEGALDIKIDNDGSLYMFNSVAVGRKSRPVDVSISLQPYSILKYNDSQRDGRFVVYWNERDTVIWDKELKKQVPNKNIWDYLHSKIEDDDDWEDE